MKFTRFLSCEWPKLVTECSQRNVQQSFIAKQPPLIGVVQSFWLLCSPNLDFYWLDLLRKKTMLSKYNYQCTVLMAWHKCCSVWRTSVQSSQYLWLVFEYLYRTLLYWFFKIGEELKISKFQNFEWAKQSKSQDIGPDVKYFARARVEKPPTKAEQQQQQGWRN